RPLGIGVGMVATREQIAYVAPAGTGGRDGRDGRGELPVFIEWDEPAFCGLPTPAPGRYKLAGPGTGPAVRPADGRRGLEPARPSPDGVPDSTDPGNGRVLSYAAVLRTATYDTKRGVGGVPGRLGPEFGRYWCMPWGWRTLRGLAPPIALAVAGGVGLVACG